MMRLFPAPSAAATVVSLGLAGVLTGLCTPAQAQETCGSFPQGATSHICQCPAGVPVGSAWGSGPYTADSNICAAAIHAGAIGTAGGLVETARKPGLQSYTGSERNGITTRDWGSFPDAFVVVIAGPAAEVAACAVLPEGADSVICSCAADAGTGSAWGSGPYTGDSDICTAARHAGVVAAAGGTVTALRIQGRDAYTGSERNGVTSRDWGSFPYSLILDANARH